RRGNTGCRRIRRGRAGRPPRGDGPRRLRLRDSSGPANSPSARADDRARLRTKPAARIRSGKSPMRPPSLLSGFARGRGRSFLRRILLIAVFAGVGAFRGGGRFRTALRRGGSKTGYAPRGNGRLGRIGRGGRNGIGPRKRGNALIADLPFQELELLADHGRVLMAGIAPQPFGQYVAGFLHFAALLVKLAQPVPQLEI